ncbi:uncharacterized protein LOC102806398 [Saccoglossus kowalevskii]
MQQKCPESNEFSFSYVQRNCQQFLNLPVRRTVLSGPTSVRISKLENIHETEYKITRSVTIHDNLKWSVAVHDKGVKAEFVQVPQTISDIGILNLLVNSVDNSNVCCGNQDPHFIEMVRGKEKM